MTHFAISPKPDDETYIGGIITNREREFSMLLTKLFRKQIIASTLVGVTIFTLLISIFPVSLVRAQAPGPQEQLFSSAAEEFKVPKELLMAISYSESRWQPRGATASVDGGYGLMDLTAPTKQTDRRGTGKLPAANSARNYTLNEAAGLLKVSPETLKKDDRQNIRGAAAVLAGYATQLHNGQLPPNLADWYDVTAKYSGASSSESAKQYADEIYASLKSGASTPVKDGNVLRLQANPNITPKTKDIQKLKFPSQKQSAQQLPGADCPPTLACHFTPAGYAQNSSDPADYGNYDQANRPQDMAIKYIVIHDTEGSYQSAINHFQDTTSYVSCNYVIRSSDGDVTQMVQNKDVAWCAGDWYTNMHGINVEHEGFAAQGQPWYTEQMYQSSAKLVRHLAQQYNIPLDREHIIGHDEVPAISPAFLAGQHWDPGPYWDWNHYMALLHGVSDEAERAQQANRPGPEETITISPAFASNQPAIADCSSGTCTTLPAQGSNMVYLHKEPSNTSPLLSDKHLHPDGAPGTNHTDDWGSKATSGQRYVVAGRQGDWTGIWYGGTIGWFYNPLTQPTALKSKGTTIRPRAGVTSIPVYGAAYPESRAYPAGVPRQNLKPLYTIPAGQAYVMSDDSLPTDYFYAPTINYSMPHDHEVIIGQEKYYQITFNKRVVYVKNSDVALRQ